MFNDNLIHDILKQGLIPVYMLPETDKQWIDVYVGIILKNGVEIKCADVGEWSAKSYYEEYRLKHSSHPSLLNK